MCVCVRGWCREACGFVDDSERYVCVIRVECEDSDVCVLVGVLMQCGFVYVK